MSILYLGDIHGKVKALSDAIKFAEENDISAIIQVGDFGFGFPGRLWDEFLIERASNQEPSIPVYTCFGNHDNWTLISEIMAERGSENQLDWVENSGVYFMPRGSFLEIDGVSHLFLGGAESTDRYTRRPGLSWWKAEEPSVEEINLFFEMWESKKPNTIVTHESPLRVESSRVGRAESKTPRVLENVFKHTSHTPQYHLYGHHHKLLRNRIEGVEHFCCGLNGEGWIRSCERGVWEVKKKSVI